MSGPTNANRADRFEAAMRAYIEYGGDSIKANEPDTWLADLLCDAQHWAKAMSFEFHHHAGDSNFEAECEEDDPGAFIRSDDWLPNAADLAAYYAEGGEEDGSKK